MNVNMLKFLKNLFIDSFEFKPERFESMFFDAYNIQYKKKGYIDEHWIYTSLDLTYKVNGSECIVLLNGKERYTIEFIHNMKYNVETLFYNIKKFY